MIGNLERLLIAILMYYNQFEAIGLVFTAKSVARFDKISKNPTFVEYYLIGSLFSMLSVLICYGIIIYQQIFTNDSFTPFNDVECVVQLCQISGFSLYKTLYKYYTLVIPLFWLMI